MSCGYPDNSGTAAVVHLGNTACRIVGNVAHFMEQLTNTALALNLFFPSHPYLITLCDPVSNLLQLFHGFFILEIIGESFSPFLQELNDFGSEGF